MAEARANGLARYRRTLRLLIPAVLTVLAIIIATHTFRDDQTTQRGGLTFASGALARDLDRQLTGAHGDSIDTRVLFTVRGLDGVPCRAFLRADSSGIACRRDGGWHLRVQRDGTDLASDDGAQAQAAERALRMAADSIAAGPPLDATQERAARNAGWEN